MINRIHGKIPGGWSALAAGLFYQPLSFNLGLIPGAKILNLFGRNSSTAAGEDIWNGSSVYTGFPVGGNAEQIELFSSNDADVGTVDIDGLDGNWSYQTESISVNGTTHTFGTKTWRRIFTGIFRKTGSDTAFNVGTITGRHKTTTANVFFQMPIGRGQTNIFIYTVPAGKKALLLNLTSAIRRGTQGASLSAVAADGSLWVREYGKSPRLRRPFVVEGGMVFSEEIPGGFMLSEKTDLTCRINSITTSGADIIVKSDIIEYDPTLIGV